MASAGALLCRPARRPSRVALGRTRAGGLTSSLFSFYSDHFGGRAARALRPGTRHAHGGDAHHTRPPAPLEMSGVVLIGLLGCGRAAEQLHVPAILRTRETRLTAVCDPVPERRQLVARAAPGCRAFATAEELFASRSVDAVLVASPPETHVALAELALRAGVPVLVEMPLAGSLAEAIHLAELERKARGSVDGGVQSAMVGAGAGAAPRARPAGRGAVDGRNADRRRDPGCHRTGPTDGSAGGSGGAPSPPAPLSAGPCDRDGARAPPRTVRRSS